MRLLAILLGSAFPNSQSSHSGSSPTESGRAFDGSWLLPFFGLLVRTPPCLHPGVLLLQQVFRFGWAFVALGFFFHDLSSACAAAGRNRRLASPIELTPAGRGSSARPQWWSAGSRMRTGALSRPGRSWAAPARSPRSAVAPTTRSTVPYPSLDAEIARSTTTPPGPVPPNLGKGPGNRLLRRG